VEERVVERQEQRKKHDPQYVGWVGKWGDVNLLLGSANAIALTILTEAKQKYQYRISAPLVRLASI
jgi:hypothetical protein